MKTHQPCPHCGSSDAMSIYETHEHCYSCGHHKLLHNEDVIITHKPSKVLTPVPQAVPHSMTDRGLSGESLHKYNIFRQMKDGEIYDFYPYYDKDNVHVANKVRRVSDKSFYWEGDAKDSVLFGQNYFPSGGKAITIVEGELDAPSGFQMNGNKFPVVSPKSGSSAKQDCVNSFEYLDSFEQIVLVMDNDEVGNKAAIQIAQLFSPGKVRIVKLQHGKDCNDYVKQGLEREYTREWFNAGVYTPDGLLYGNDPSLYEDVINYKEPHSIPYPWKGLNKALYGMRLAEMTLFLADTGIGKTTFMKEIEYKLLTDPELIERGYGVGILHLEEPKRDIAIGLMGIHHNKPYHLPDTERTIQELNKAYDEVVNTNRLVIYDHFGSNDIDVVLSKIRHMAAMGCKYIVLDHLSIIVSDQSGDERKQLDEISTKLKTLTMNLNICLICVIHINRQGSVRGSAGPEQVSNNTVRLERDKKDADEWRRNVTRMVVEKCRLSGRTGPAAYVYYDGDTGRLIELEKDAIDIFESGMSITGNEFAIYQGGA